MKRFLIAVAAALLACSSPAHAALEQGWVIWPLIFPTNAGQEFAGWVPCGSIGVGTCVGPGGSDFFHSAETTPLGCSVFSLVSQSTTMGHTGESSGYCIRSGTGNVWNYAGNCGFGFSEPFSPCAESVLLCRARTFANQQSCACNDNCGIPPLHSP